LIIEAETLLMLKVTLNQVNALGVKEDAPVANKWWASR
jgi:hypothetical protein